MTDCFHTVFGDGTKQLLESTSDKKIQVVRNMIEDEIITALEKSGMQIEIIRWKHDSRDAVIDVRLKDGETPNGDNKLYYISIEHQKDYTHKFNFENKISSIESFEETMKLDDVDSKWVRKMLLRLLP